MAATSLTYNEPSRRNFDNRMEVVIAENLVNLDEKELGEDLSDWEFIVADFESNNYAAKVFDSEARRLGSWPPRRRKYMVALDNLTELNHARLIMLETFLQAMQIGEGRWEDFLLDDDERQKYYCADAEPDAKKVNNDHKYLE